MPDTITGQLTPNNGFGLPDLSIIQQMQDALNGQLTLNNLNLASATFSNNITVNGEVLAAAGVQQIDQSALATLVGAVAQPVSGTVAAVIRRVGNDITLNFTFTAARIAVTDAGASGSFGATKIFDFVETALAFQGSRLNITAVVEGAALTTGAGDADYVLGIGTTNISAAADKVLAAAATNVSGGSLAITDSAGTGVGSLVAVPAVATAGVDGTTTASDLYLNWSGSAATIDANSTIDFTGTATVNVILLGDD